MAMIRDFDEGELLRVFTRLLKERKDVGGFNSEDAVRYTFFHALTLVGFSHFQVQLETPLPTYRSRLLDLRAISGLGLPMLAAEFKYHRERGSALPMPALAGGIFADLARLAVAHHAWKCPCYFIYLTDERMMKYLTQPRHGCNDIVCSRKGESVEFNSERLATRGKTFLKATNGFMEPGSALCVEASSISAEYALRVFRIEHKPDALYSYV